VLDYKIAVEDIWVRVSTERVAIMFRPSRHVFRPSVLIIYGVSTECINQYDVFRPSALIQMTHFDQVATILLHTISYYCNFATPHTLCSLRNSPLIQSSLQLCPPEKTTMLIVTEKEPPAQIVPGERGTSSVDATRQSLHLR
jgi:hypothetical protein